MKLRALRVADVRRFDTPVAVEKISDGLNILASPNEAGKSTLLRALDALFQLRFKTSGQKLDELRPYAGGQPFIEADFDVGDGQWRYRKQFGRGARADLMLRASGEIVARNSDAEVQVAELLGGGADAAPPFGLVFVGQHHALHLPQPDFDAVERKSRTATREQSALRSALAQEITAAATGDTFQRVKARVEEMLRQLRTKGRAVPKTGGPLHVAMEHVNALQHRHDAAAAALAAAKTQTEALRTLKRQRAERADPEQRRLESERCHELERQRDALLAADARRAGAEQSLKLATLSLEQVMRRRDEAQLLLKQSHAMTAALEQARQLSQQLGDAGSALANNGATRRAIQQLEALETSIAMSQAKLVAASADVAITLTDAGRGGVRMAGTPLTQSTEVKVAEQLQISVDGIAEISVTMPGAKDAAQLRAVKARAKADRVAHLQALGVDSLEEALRLAAQRDTLEQRIQSLTTELARVAPDGVEALAGRLQALLVPTADALQAFESDVTHAASARDAAQLDLAQATQAAAGADQLGQVRDALAVLEKAVEQRRNDISDLDIRIANIAGQLDGTSEDATPHRLSELSDALADAEREVHHYTRRAEALALLGRTLADIEDRNRQTYSAPLRQRLEPRLETLMGARSLSFEDGFRADRLERKGRTEPISALSDGTREQLSVLVRLGFAEVLAAAAQPLPLVLDDPLVYSDDARLKQVLAMLEDAASGLQIIILTCRSDTFAAVSANRLVVTPWQRSET